MQALKEHVQLLARYNRAANDRLYEACAQVDPIALERPSAAPFGTVLGLLEHVIAADEVWLARFEGDASARLPSREARRPLGELRAVRTELDARIATFVVGLPAERLGQPILSVNSSGVASRRPLSNFLAHMFNHQTHHRAQVQVLLREAGVTGVVLDLYKLTAG